MTTIPITNDHDAAAPGHSWIAGEVVEVEEKLAAEILAIKDAGFRVVEKVEAEVKAVEEKVMPEVDPQASFSEVAPEVTQSK